MITKGDYTTDVITCGYMVPQLTFYDCAVNVGLVSFLVC